MLHLAEEDIKNSIELYERELIRPINRENMFLAGIYCILSITEKYEKLNKVFNKIKEVLLQRKSKGRFGEGKWNLPGGKVKPRETFEKAAERELEEETGIKANKLKEIGVLNFYWSGIEKPIWIVHIFSVEDFYGEERESEEGELKWFDLSNLPFNEMCEDDKFWYPYLLSKKFFVGNFYFTKNFEKLLRYEIEVEK
jgi:8-oxo-dGTP pyrophosphatase MutT (NUDIX family)